MARISSYRYNFFRGILASLLLGDTGIPPSAFSVAPTLRTGAFSVPPVYIIHGDIDDKVPVQQAIDVVAALKEMNAEVEYHEVEGLNHGFDRDPECMMDSMYAFVARVFST